MLQKSDQAMHQIFTITWNAGCKHFMVGECGPATVYQTAADRACDVGAPAYAVHAHVPSSSSVCTSKGQAKDSTSPGK